MTNAESSIRFAIGSGLAKAGIDCHEAIDRIMEEMFCPFTLQEVRNYLEELEK